LWGSTEISILLQHMYKNRNKSNTSTELYISLPISLSPSLPRICTWSATLFHSRPINGSPLAHGMKSSDIRYRTRVFPFPAGSTTCSWCRWFRQSLCLWPRSIRPGWERPMCERVMQGGAKDMSMGYGSYRGMDGMGGCMDEFMGGWMGG